MQEGNQEENINPPIAHFWHLVKTLGLVQKNPAIVSNSVLGYVGDGGGIVSGFKLMVNGFKRWLGSG